MARLTKDRQFIKNLRLKTLSEQNEIWKSNCDKCTRICDAVKDGTLPTYSEEGKKIFWTADRQNPICASCPAHYQLLESGKKLIQLTNYDRALR